MNSVFLRNGRYAAHVVLWPGPFLCGFGEESFKSRGSDIDEHADRLIGIPLTGGLASLGLSLVQADDRATVDRVEAFTAVLAPAAEVGL
jgi:hypothetical protein